MMRPKMSRHSCEFCMDHWNTVVRLFSSEKEFMDSEFYGGGDKVVNDPNGVTVAVWPGKNNVNKGQGEWEICAPVHPHCGCHFEEYSFSVHTLPKEDWYSKLDFSDLDDDFQKSTSGKVLKEVQVTRGGKTFTAKRWVKVDYGNEFENPEKPKVDKVCRGLFGKSVSESSLARLAGAHGNEKVKIETVGNDTVKISVRGEHYATFRRIQKDKDNNLFIQMKKTYGIPDRSKSAKGKGIAIHQVVTMVREGKKLGVKYIKGDFIRSTSGYDGYYKFARLGFDGRIAPDLRMAIKRNFSDYEEKYNTVQKFIMKYGLDAWGKYGGKFEGKFDLTSKEQLYILIKRIRSIKNAE